MFVHVDAYFIYDVENCVFGNFLVLVSMHLYAI